jgi:2,4-dienoyl-CoA reductase-like NADH-dependent reductase (Old Yellow Enzyme family)
MSSPDILFSPCWLSTLELPNRVVMAAMTRSFSPDGAPIPAAGHRVREP